MSTDTHTAEQAKRVAELVQKWINITGDDEHVVVIDAALGMLMVELHVTAALDLGDTKAKALLRLQHSLAGIEKLFGGVWDDFHELRRGALQ
jgi:hypothetical protein